MSLNDEFFYMDHKKGKILLHDKYQYHLIRKYKNGSSVMRCSQYRKSKCPGTITIKDDILLKKIEHKCEMDFSRNIMLKEKATLQERIKTSDAPIPQLYQDCMVQMNDKGLNMVAPLPSFTSMKHSLYDTRNKSIGATKTVFSDVEEFKIPNKFSDYVLGDYSFNKTRIILFCCQKSRELFSKVKESFVDSTFKSCPKPFSQLLSIHGDFDSTSNTVNVKPLIYALMSNKKQSSYVVLLEIIKSQLGWSISVLHCDFEVAFINAVKQQFPEIIVIGCFYHWMRTVWRKAKLLKLKTKDENRIVQMCVVLPLLPENKILEGWAYIQEEHDEANLNMSDFMKYMNAFMKKPNFVKLLSVFGQRHRTNNVVESWHSYLNKHLNKNTVNILRLLNVLQKIDALTHITIGVKSRRKEEQIKRDDFIRHVQMQLLNGVITLGHAIEKLR